MLQLPIGYYTFLRLVVFVTSAIIVWNELKGDGILTLWGALFGLIGLFFNPVVPVYLHSKVLWKSIDFFAACIFLVYGIITTKSK